MSDSNSRLEQLKADFDGKRQKSKGIPYTYKELIEAEKQRNGGQEEIIVRGGVQRAIDRMREEPLVPAGILLTVGALVGSAYAIRVGNKDLANRMFRYRVGFQFATMAVLVGGGILFGEQRAAKRRQIEEKENMVLNARRDAWLQDLKEHEAQKNSAPEPAC